MPSPSAPPSPQAAPTARPKRKPPIRVAGEWLKRSRTAVEAWKAQIAADWGGDLTGLQKSMLDDAGKLRAALLHAWARLDDRASLLMWRKQTMTPLLGEVIQLEHALLRLLREIRALGKSAVATPEPDEPEPSQTGALDFEALGFKRGKGRK